MNDLNELEVVQAESSRIVTMTPMDLMQKALENNVDPDQLGKLMDLQERYEAKQAQKAFSAALAGFQAVVPTIHKNATADRYGYASFDHIMGTIKPLLATAGLSVRFSTEMTGDSVITVICTISHRDGHSETSQFSAPVDSQMRVNSTQKMASANSYACRYAIRNALNLSIGDFDDDGAGAGTPLIDESQVAIINDYIESIGDDWDQAKQDKFLEWLKAQVIEDIAVADFPRAVNFLRGKAK
jgi:hypothetical protein